MFFWLALFMASIALQYAQLSAPKSVLAASGLLADTVQGFEIDGDLKGNNASSNPGSVPNNLINNPPMADGQDWLDPNGVASLPSTNTKDTFLDTDATDPGDTSAYGGGNKEDDTRDWVYVNSAGPNPKTDFKHIMAHAEVVGNSAFAYLGAERMVNNGTMVVDFELNKKPFKQYSTGPAKPDRSNGDLLISLEYSNGGSNPIVTIYQITNVQTFASGQTVTFVKVSDADTLDAVRSATNFVDLTGSGFGYTVPSFDFAEASIDLSKLGITTGCPGFSTGHIRSRTGGDPQSSQLKDAAPPFNIDLNNCGKVTIVKNAIPNSAQDFDFTTTGGAPLANFSLDDDNDPTLSKTKVFNQVPPGDYTVTEGTVDGWQLTGLVCDDANGSVSLANRKATLKVDPNEEITCTYTNTKLGKIIVEKQTEPDGSAGTFTFTGDAAGDLQDNGQIVVDNLLPGTYTSTEADPTPPFDLGSINCDDNDSSGNVGTRTATFHLQAGETVTCVFTNVKRGSITIIKDAQPNDPQDFAFTTSGSGLSGFSLDDDSDNTLSNTKTFTNVVPGTKSVTETDVNGWELTNLVCNGTLGSTGTRSGNTANIDLKAGGSVTCTFTNVKAGRILVDKVTDPAGEPQKFTFNPSYNGGQTFQLADADPVNDSGDLKPGNYSVTESAQAGWDLTSASCDNGDMPDAITLDPGEVVTCTFENTKRGHVIDKKVMVGGTSTFDFTGTPSGSISQNNGTLDQEVKPGQYTSTEAAKAGWDLTGISCDDANSGGDIGTATATFNVEPGETVTCTFTNTKRGTIIVEKQTVPDGAQGSFAFTGDAAGSIGDGGTIVVDNLKPGTYTSTEGDPGAEFDLGAIVCNDANSTGDVATATATFQLEPGETVTCTFTNVQRGSITIIKDADPQSEQDFGFTTTGSGLSNFSLDDNGNNSDTLSNTKSFINLLAGDYSVTESDVAGWDLTKVDCETTGGSSAEITGATADLTLTSGGSITCVYHNAMPSIQVVKTAGDAADGKVFSTEPGLVIYHYHVTNTGPLPLHDVVVTDDNGTPGDTGDDFTADCSGQTTLDVGASMDCTAEVIVTKDTTNVAVAEGTSPGGTKVDDDDDAVVEILVHGLVIAKSNDAPLETLELPDGTTADLPTADEGETVTFTLKYTFSGDPVTNAVITDCPVAFGPPAGSTCLPIGFTYVEGSASSDDQFTFQGYDETTRTLTWTAATVNHSGQLTYEVKIDEGASEIAQPLENLATIDSDQTPPDDDRSDVFVPTIPLEETAPPTDVLAAPQGQSAPGSSLLLTLVVLGGIVMLIGFVTPVPATIRRRKDR